jgi:phage gpG-like protein
MAKGKVPGGGVITPAQIMQQWKHASHRFDLNLNNFEVRIGRAAADIFKKSFEMHRFNTASSQPWKQRRDRKPHPILKETSTLKNSIKHKTMTGQKRVVRIYTDPTAFGTAARHRGFCYAAVHNDTSGSHTYGNSGVKSIQRQFMGHSSYLEDEFKKLVISTLFNGFPK